MLVLSRAINEKIMIGDNISVTVIGINRDGKVRIGVDAPKEISVHRREIWLAIKQPVRGKQQTKGTSNENEDYFQG